MLHQLKNLFPTLFLAVLTLPASFAKKKPQLAFDQTGKMIFFGLCADQKSPALVAAFL